MVVTIALALHNSLAVVPGQECQRMHGFHVLVVLLLQNSTHHSTCCCIVLYQTHVILVAVQFKHIDAFAIGSP